MSEFLVLDELGSEASRSSESRHADEQGEFGVTWSAEERCDVERRRVKSVKRASFAMLSSTSSVSRHQSTILLGVKGVSSARSSQGLSRTIVMFNGSREAKERATQRRQTTEETNTGER